MLLGILCESNFVIKFLAKKANKNSACNLKSEYIWWGIVAIRSGGNKVFEVTFQIKDVFPYSLIAITNH
jgi:hypothetical protein